jgi:hypothetical protein
VVSSLAVVLDAIARTVLGDADDSAVTVGGITLRAHQRDALRRLRASIDETGGALLADEPGLGKTFVALALAREYPGVTVVAPAALRDMWRSAAAQAGVEAPFISMESLSRGDVRMHARDALVIVDEAHHVCNPATARYVRLAKMVSYRRVLLLSATPVRNRRDELSALLALFMGPRAYTLDDAVRSRCVIRRAGDESLRPAIDGPHWHRVRAVPRLREMIATLPPPLPALDGHEATALLSMTLARCWASSLAALAAALKRRLQRGAALESLLDAGRMPTRDELRAWVVGDDAVQMAFPMFAAHETADATRLRAVLERHLDAVRALRTRITPHVTRDAGERAKLLLELRRNHVAARIVAFTAHAATAEALYRALRDVSGVALLTARGARTAGGPRPRSDVIDALAAAAAPTTPANASARDSSGRVHRRDDVSLVITTDLLSEGVNLQGASVIVHLDVPWTPAGLDQRVGRAARMGSAHACVHVHGIEAPAAAERLLKLGRRFARKHAAQAEAARAPRDIERLRAIVQGWRASVRQNVRFDVQNAEDAEVGQHPQLGGHAALVARVRAVRAGFVAVVEMSGSRVMLCGARSNAPGRWTISDAPDALCEIAGAVSARDVAPDEAFESDARAALERWLAGRRARESTGAAGAPSRARRLLLARLDSAGRRAAAHSRAALAERIAHVRAAIDQAISAGAEDRLNELAQNRAPDLESLLAACETRLESGTLRAGPAAPRERESLRALLLLRPA